jgi:hypothetical protein
VNEERVKQLIRELDEEVPREGKLALTDSDEGGTLVQANSLGYLRLGIELLKAAHAPRSQAPRVEVDFSYLTNIDEPCYVFERREDVELRPRPTDSESSGGGIGALIGVAILLFFFLSFLVGAWTILSWMLKLLLSL